MVVLAFVLNIIFCQITVIMLKTPRSALKIIWFSIWGIFFSLGLFAYFFYNEYLRMIELRCLFNIDKYDCGGTRATAYYVRKE